MFNYDSAMADPESHIFTNVSQTNSSDAQSEYDYMYDDFGTQVYSSDLVMKVVFSKKEIIKDRLIKVTFAKYVTIDNYIELIDDIGIEYQDYSFAMEGKEYLQKKLEGALDRE
ncbi:hypothetical protein ACFFH2_15770 [Enterococcus devriesei]|uniref:hypothetical protein n=1 Tax=Enterococcus devriesei TaxID=319970 RepID=UPI0035EA2A3A